MSTFLEALHSGKVLLMDGAMGTELMRRGLPPGTSGEFWNVRNPDTVRAIHAEYVSAGAVCLLTNTFLARDTSHPTQHLTDEVWETINHAGVRLLRSTCPPRHFVLGDIGPPLEFWHTAAPGAKQELVDECVQQMDWLDPTDVLLLETQSSLAFVKAIWENPFVCYRKQAVILSFTFNHDIHGPRLHPSGETPEQVAQFAEQHRSSLIALGVNCGRHMGFDEIIQVLRRYRKVTNLPLLARPNAGTPRKAGDSWMHPRTPIRFAAQVPDLVDAGVTLLGGCCGTTPAHIEAMRAVLDKLGALWQP